MIHLLGVDQLLALAATRRRCRSDRAQISHDLKELAYLARRPNGRIEVTAGLSDETLVVASTKGVPPLRTAVEPQLVRENS
jgi:hypothetical protein